MPSVRCCDVDALPSMPLPLPPLSLSVSDTLAGLKIAVRCFDLRVLDERVSLRTAPFCCAAAGFEVAASVVAVDAVIGTAEVVLSLPLGGSGVVEFAGSVDVVDEVAAAALAGFSELPTTGSVALFGTLIGAAAEDCDLTCERAQDLLFARFWAAALRLLVCTELSLLSSSSSSSSESSESLL